MSKEFENVFFDPYLQKKSMEVISRYQNDLLGLEKINEDIKNIELFLASYARPEKTTELFCEGCFLEWSKKRVLFFDGHEKKPLIEHSIENRILASRHLHQLL